MKMTTSAALLAAVLLGLAPAVTAVEPAGRLLRPSDLLDAPETYLNRTVEVDIVETLRGVGGVSNAQACVGLPERVGCVLSLVPPAFRPDDAERGKLRFEAPLAAPLRVRGELLRDDALTQTWPGYVLRVSSVETLPPETPTRVESVAELVAHQHDWDRRRVVVEGTWLHGFERSNLDRRELWLSLPQEALVLGRPKKPAPSARVRVTGLVFSRPGSGYGHLGAATALLVASRLEYLGGAR